jgi:hypothetical protein
MTTEVQQTPFPAWGRSNSFLSFGDSQTPLTQAGLVDRLNILDVLGRYAWSYDERNIAALESGFTEDAVWEGSVAGSFAIEPIRGRQAISDWLQGHMAAQNDQRRHNAINHIFVSQTETAAEVLSYLLLTSASEGSTRVITSGFYRVRFVKAEGGVWQIEHMFGGFDNPF